MDFSKYDKTKYMNRYIAKHKLNLCDTYDEQREMKDIKDRRYKNFPNTDDSIINIFKKQKESEMQRKEDLANYIQNNYDTMDTIELYKTALKCLSEHDIRRILLNHELIYYKETNNKKMTLDEFGKKAMIILNRYQSKAGGFLLEDNNWRLYKHEDTDNTNTNTNTYRRHEVMKNEIVFENTFDITDFDDLETEVFLKRIVNRLQMIGSNIDVELRFITDEKDKIIYTLIWATDKDYNDEQGEPEIGL